MRVVGVGGAPIGSKKPGCRGPGFVAVDAASGTAAVLALIYYPWIVRPSTRAALDVPIV